MKLTSLKYSRTCINQNLSKTTLFVLIKVTLLSGNFQTDNILMPQRVCNV